MNRAQQYRYQPEHGESGLFSYLDTFFRKYAGRDFFYTGRSVAYFFLFVLLFSLTAFADTATEASSSASDMYVNVQAAWYEDSYHITNPDGGRSGYGYEYEQAVASYTGWDYIYVQDDWTALFEMLENGRIDIMSAISYTDERAEHMLFSERPMGVERYYLYVNLADSGISPTKLSSLNGKRIAVMEKTVQYTQYCDWEKQHNITTIHVPVDSIDEAKALFAAHKLDGVVSTETSIWADAGLTAIIDTGSSDIYFGISKQRPDLKEKLDAAMRSMESDKPFYANELYKRYIATQTLSPLTMEEKDWLAQHGSIRIGYQRNDPGFSVEDPKTGQVTGVLNDYIMYATDCLDETIHFEIVGFDTLQAALSAVQNGKIDMVFHVSQNPYYAERSGVSLSNTVLSIPLAVVTAQDAFNESVSNTIAIVKKDAQAKWYISNKYPFWTIVKYDSYEEAEQAVERGEADGMLIRAAQAMQYVNDKELHSVYLTQAGEVSFAVDRGNRLLNSILNKTLKTMQSTKLTGAVSMYEDATKKVTLLDFVKDNLLPVTISCLSLFLLILAVILGFLRNARLAAARAERLNAKLQESEQELKHALTQAESANAAKTTFLNNMSHDIRTPMNAIIGFTNIALSMGPEEKVRNCLEKIMKSSDYLMSLINDVLDISRIESGKIKYEPVPCDITGITDTVLAVAHGFLQGRNIEFVVERATPTAKYVYADELRIREVLINILSNAIKFTKDGGTIRFEVKDQPVGDGKHVQVRYRISDTGIGMSEEYQVHLYEEFSQESDGARTNYKGTGLGMAITKRYVDMMHGEIYVKSKQGVGTTFTVELPLRIAETAPDTKEKCSCTERDLQGVRVLMAEDNDLNAEIAITLLEEKGLVVIRAIDGQDVIDQFRAAPAGSYDLILMDIMMPQLNGYEATQAIRSMSDRPDGRTIPIVAMTANAFAEDIAATHAAGMNGHLAKPIDMDEVMKVICRVLTGSMNMV